MSLFNSTRNTWKESTELQQHAQMHKCINSKPKVVTTTQNYLYKAKTLFSKINEMKSKWHQLLTIAEEIKRKVKLI